MKDVNKKCTIQPKNQRTNHLKENHMHNAISLQHAPEW